MHIALVGWGCSIVLLASLGAYFHLSLTPDNERPEHTELSHHISHDYVSPVEKPIIAEPQIVKLGFQLFVDTNLSSNRKVSCESCHHLNGNGAEDTKVSVGVAGAGSRNSQTVFNVSLNSRFFWDGRAASLEHQIDGPIHSPLEMNTNWNDVVSYVKKSPIYAEAFKASYNGVVSEQNIKNALVTFMEALLTPDAPFDKYLKGDHDAINQTAQLGWEKFQKLGCVICHQGQNIGGNLFQKLGNVQGDRLLREEHDLGRYNVTGNESDKLVFRVSSLRNVARTPPYFHDGRAETLEEAIVIMAKLQLGQELDAASIIEISAFLSTLTAPNPIILEELTQ
ncbi:cytochrome-c peroxidase [Photobacterium sp. OFAV2-7]|uniref:cytochrome-c peroxidase n=1 Tax=Photobacterium sp. OFAV2-7 TaxID=2917748 RepID=UPI001EF50A8E|nr:cytochrome c peroxidase [Photobacterium sp. OFAV2-7]MCG7586240.1 cytochrome B6 [Photobacterium sp. OFAV2-7]